MKRENVSLKMNDLSPPGLFIMDGITVREMDDVRLVNV